MVIRDATASDVQTVYDLGCALPLEVRQGTIFCPKDEIALYVENGIVLIAVDKDDVVGFLVGTHPTSPHTPYACLMYVGVRRDHQRRGIGREMVRQGYARLRERADIVYVWAAAGEPIEAMLRSMGFLPGKVYRWMDCSRPSLA